MALTTGAATGAPSLRAVRRRYSEDVVKAVLALCALVSVATTVGIVLALLLPALEFFSEISVVDFLTGTEWAPLFEPSHFGVIPLIVGTLSVTFWACVVCMPFGLGAAIYLSEYARPRVRAVLKPALELLAGIPTVVYGYFALTFVTPLMRDLGLEAEVFNALSAGLVMGVMLIPTVASLSEDAMSAVPQALRQGSYALGANKMRTTMRVVFPAAISGITAAVVLGLSRAVGETMIVALAAGTRAQVVTDPTMEGQTMTGFIAQAASGDQQTGSVGYESLFAVAAVLFALTFLMNIVSIRLVRRWREVYE